MEGWETLGTNGHTIYQLVCVINFFATTHRLGCTLRQSLLEGGGRGKCITLDTKAPAFLVNLYASRRCHGVTVLITTGVAGHSFALR
jgi:hypothetical protein